MRMLRRLLARLVGGGRGEETGKRDDEESGDEASEDDDSGFLPSRLDASVLHAHGMGNGGAEREIDQIEEKAEILEAEHHRDE